MSNEITLLPCAFCGGEASVKVLEYDDDCKVWGVFCESDLESEYSHGHFVDNYPTEAEAIAAWNTRAELGSGTCEVVSSRFDEMMDEWCIELSCGHCVWDRTEPPNFCEECGAHIRKAVAR